MQLYSRYAIKRVGYGCLLLIAVWVAFTTWLHTGFQRGQHELKDSSLLEFQKSDMGKWIALPDSARKITTFSYLGFDTNYRFLKATFSESPSVLSDLIFQSIALQPLETNDTYFLNENAKITYEKFASLFHNAKPSWWKTEFSRFNQQAFCVWENTNGYGYGYIYLYDSTQKELRVFQWSQQHNTVEFVRDLFEK